MKIGPVQLDNFSIMAPLAGITNIPFRLLARKAGAGLVCSEMISSNGIIHRSQKTLNMLNSDDGEKPLSVQLFGSDPDIMAAAASVVEASGADIVDINLGCSVKKIVKTGSGIALMRNPENTEAILKSVRKSVSIPLTLKMRSGWDASGDQAIRIAEIAEYCGVDAITIHPRTATQGFRGTSDWMIIKAVKQKVSIPVIGNGDIQTAEDAFRMRQETGCDGVMIGRAAIGNVWLFKQINRLEKGLSIIPPTISDIQETMMAYLNASVEYLGEKQACLMMRSRLGWFSRGLPFSTDFRKSITQIQTKSDATEKILSFMDSIRQADTP